MPWGLDRLGKVLSGTVGGVLSSAQAPFGLVKDAWTAGWDEGPDSTLGSVFTEDTPERFGQFFRGLLGPESGVGALAGGLPEGVRAPGRAVLEGAQTAYREGVAEPLSTLVTVSSLAESDIYKGQTGEGGLGVVLRKRTWREAYGIAQHRSPGQAVALTTTDDVMDETEVEEFRRTDAFNIISGVTDAAANIALDPTAVAGAGAAKARRAIVVKPISGMDDLERASAVRRLERFNTAVGKATEGMSPEQATSVIRHRFFPNHSSGAALASVLADAGDDATRMRVVRAAAGDVNELDALRTDQAALANRVARAQGQSNALRVLEERGFELPRGIGDEAAALEDELTQLYGEQNTLARREAAYATLQAVPRASAVSSLRSTVTRSEVYQKSRWAAPVRVVFDMRPHRLVNLEEATGDVQVARMLRKSSLPVEEQERIRGMYARSVDAGQRERVLLEAETAAVRSIAESAGMTVEQVDGLLAAAGRNRATAQQVLRSRVYDGEGRSLLRLREDGPPTDLPLLVSQTANVLPVADMDAVRRATTKMGQFAMRHPATAIPEELAERFTRIWKPAVLLRPAWPMRVILDEQLRIAAKIGGLAQLRAFSTGAVNRLGTVVEDADRYRQRAAELGRPLTNAERKAVRREAREQRSPGLQGFEERGYALEGAFGGPGEPNIYTRLVSSRASFDRFFSRATEELEDGVRRDLQNTAEWRSLTPDEPSYARAWEHDVNRQIGADALARRLLESVVSPAPLLRRPPASSALVEGTPFYFTADVVGRAGNLSPYSGPAPRPQKFDLDAYDLDEPIPGVTGQLAADLAAAGDEVAEARIRAALARRDARRPGPGADLRNAERALEGSSAELEAALQSSVSSVASERLERLYTQAGVAALRDAVERGSSVLQRTDEGWRLLSDQDISALAATEMRGGRLVVAPASSLRDTPVPRGTGGFDVEAAADWLRNDPAGQRYARRLPYRRNHEQWARTVAEQLESYLPTAALKQAALEGKATASLLAREVPDAAARPVVHGEVLAQALGTSVTGKFVSGAVEKMYAALGQAPTDALSRQPFFDAMYQAEAKRLIGVLDGQRPGGLGNADVTLVQERARRYALKETRDMLYDLAEESELSHLLRFVSPFFNAWQEVGTVWAGLAVENPAFVRRLTIAWQAPNRAGLVQTDQNGEEYVVVPLPPGSRSLPYVGGALGSVGDFRFAKASLNTVLGGLPGTGPLVQLPVYAVAKDRPDLASNTFVEKTIFPYGVPSSVRDLLLPATAKRLYSLNKEEEDRAFAVSYAQIMATETVRFNTGQRDAKPVHAEVLDKTKRLYALRAAVSWMSPVGGTFDSPYQLHIEAYRNLREEDPTTADARFLDMYGEDYFTLTTAVSRTVDGVPPTLEAWKARREREGLVNQLREPRLASLIVGAEGAGEFNRSVYEYQLVTSVKPGATATQRKRFSPEEQAAGAEVRLGWLQYRKLMDTLDAELERRGLRTYQAKGADDLAVVKKNALADFAERYPAWYADYTSVDRGAAERRLADLRMIASDTGLAQRPDIVGLRSYLAIRDAVQRELRGREAKTLDAQSNSDVKTVFQAAVDDLVLGNLAFADLYRRWLDRDEVAA